MGRFNTRFRPPPVRIGLAQARVAQANLTLGTPRFSRAAGGFGAREHRNADVPIRLRIDKYAGPNTPVAQQAILPMGRTRRKKGYPPITSSILAPQQKSESPAG